MGMDGEGGDDGGQKTPMGGEGHEEGGGLGKAHPQGHQRGPREGLDGHPEDWGRQELQLHRGLLAFSINLIGFFGGGAVAALGPLFSENPWILALYPPILTVRGNLSGLYSGNLSTMLHLGLILPRFRGNTDYYSNLNRVIFFLTFIDTMIIGLVSFMIGLIFKI
jgi:hypothetical protein